MGKNITYSQTAWFGSGSGEDKVLNCRGGLIQQLHSLMWVKHALLDNVLKKIRLWETVIRLHKIHDLQTDPSIRRHRTVRIWVESAHG